MVERHRITTLGISPTLIRSLIPHGEPSCAATTCYRLCASSPLLASPGTRTLMWLFDVAAAWRRLPIINYSGGN
jgi:acetyl-CoA synthetase